MYQLNTAALEFAKKLIAQGRVDEGWGIPTEAADANYFLGGDGAYPVVQLDDDGSISVGTNLLRRVRHQAGLAGETEIYQAASDLLQLTGGHFFETKKKSADPDEDGFWVDLFYEGKWTDDCNETRTWTEADIDGLITAFNETTVRPPLRAGDHEDSILKPAFGWVSKLEKRTVEGAAHLYGYLTNVPQIVQDAFQAKRYRTVSIGLWKNWEHTETGVTYPWIMNHVAILGATLPAVSGLEDLDAYMSSYHANGAEAICFSCQDEETEMDKIKELENKVADLTAKLDTALTENKDLKTKVIEHETKAAETEVTHAVDQAVADGKLLPADRDTQLEIGKQLRTASNYSDEKSAYQKWTEALKGAEKTVEFGEKAVTGEEAQNASGEEAEMQAGREDARKYLPNRVVKTA